jgi:hypothetical protein
MKLWPLTICLLAAGCDGSLPPCANGSCGMQVSTHATTPSIVNRKVDILFVVDDTPAIAPHRDAIATGIADIARTLTNAPQAISLHAGFVRAGSCDATTRGAACGIRAPEQFARAEWCNTMTNVPGTLADAFSCLADLGAGDCAPAQPLSAALAALTGSPRAGWEGFLRRDAYLLIVVVAAEDDASAQGGTPTPVAELAARAKSLKADPSQVLVSAIGPGGCAAGDVPGPRLLEFVQSFGANGLYVGLCGEPLTAAVQRVGEFTNQGLAPPCVANVRDTDVVMPGVQPNCTLVRISADASGRTVSTVIPSCDDGAPPCWRLLPGTCSGGASGYVASIDSRPDWCLETPSTFTIECLSCADPNDPACAVVAAR